LSILTIQTPRAFLPFLRPAIYKGAFGGRGSGKSHFFAELLVEEALLKHIRAACLREVQVSIKDSVKQLIEDKIRALGVSGAFEVTEKEIRGPNDSLFVFRGLQNHTATSIKSLEGFNRAWVEEAQTISQKSLDLATPTFRRPDTEMFFSWNPVKETDPVDKFFRENKHDPDFICHHLNWWDNPWFPDKLRKDMERDKLRDPDKYAHVWLGDYQRLSEARVFKNWKVESFETPRGVDLLFGADWGFSTDPTVLVRSFVKGRTLYVDQEAYMVGCEIDGTPHLFDTVDDAKRWPIIADSARPETISYMQRNGYPKIVPARKGPGSVEEGVEFLKNFDIVVHPRCKHTAYELASYSYKVDKLTNLVLPVLADEDNHVIDALRYSAERLRRVTRAVTGTLVGAY
jgi:phage terminase large subunit